MPNKLPDLVESTISKRDPILISGNGKNAVLIADTDWLALNETFSLLSLLSLPGLRDAIQNGMSESLESTSKELKW